MSFKESEAKFLVIFLNQLNETRNIPNSLFMLLDSLTSMVDRLLPISTNSWLSRVHFCSFCNFIFLFQSLSY